MEYLTGVIAKHENGNLVINGTISTQKGLTIRTEQIKGLNLKVGDKVEYWGRPYDTVNISRIIEKKDNTL